MTVRGEPDFQAVCSCRGCQERTGSAFGMSVYYPDAQVEALAGAPSVFRRTSAKHRALDFRFCPRCGVNVWWRAEFYPNGLGIAGALLGDGFVFTPKFAVWHRSLPGFLGWSDPAMPVYARGSSDGAPLDLLSEP